MMHLFKTYSFWLIMLSGTWLSAQTDAHYWTHQYGAKGLLLNGAVIASAEGETALFYNPGLIGMDGNTGFSFSFLSPTYSRLDARNFIGDGNLLTDKGLGNSPGFFGAKFKPFKSDRFMAGTTVFKRFKTNINFRSRVTDRVNESQLFLFRGDIDFSRRVSEEWYGLGLFYRLTDDLGIGMTQFSVWHSQSLRFNLKKEIVASTDAFANLFSWRSEFGYGLSVSNGFLTKFGLSVKKDLYDLGLTITTPMYARSASSANYYLEDQRINRSEDSEFYTSSQRDRAKLQNFITPFSVGFGLDLKFKSGTYSFATEYFGAVQRHVLFEEESESFEGLSLDPVIVKTSLTTERQKVLNFAFGFLHNVSDNVKLLTGFRTDFDQNPSLEINNSIEYLGTTGDVFHFSGGGMFQFEKNQLSIGFDLGIGKKSNGIQLVDLNDITVENLFEITGKNNVSTTYYTGMIFLTYDFILSIF